MRRALPLCLVLAACSPGRRESAASPPSATSPAAIAPAATSAAAATPSPRATDPRWIAARDEDPAERARLAGAVGAVGLLEGVEDGGETEKTALLALPLADDAESALGRLGELATAAPPERLRLLLAAILAIAGEPRRPREVIDPDGARRCGEAMIGIAGRAGAAREERALAVSAARALAEKGWVDSRRIPELESPK